MTNATSHPRGSVYFISHGGPPTMFDTKSEPYKAWEKIGKQLTEARPRGLVVVSAHWENDANSPNVLVNVDNSNPLVYDFYGFPAHFYEQTFDSHGDASMLSSIKSSLKSSNIGVEEVRRGLDHGSWVPFLVAFKGKTDIPIVQVSLPGDSSPVSCAAIGRALSGLQNEGYTIIATGQVVHNLRDWISGIRGSYGKPFLQAVSSALISPDPTQSTINLFKHPQYKQAHPTPEHLLPLAVAVGASGDAKVEELFISDDASLGWGMWRWV